MKDDEVVGLVCEAHLGALRGFDLHAPAIIGLAVVHEMGSAVQREAVPLGGIHLP